MLNSLLSLSRKTVSHITPEFVKSLKSRLLDWKNPSSIGVQIPFKCITPETGQFFFGYYDNPAWSGDDQFHLCHRVKFWNRLPSSTDVATIGMVQRNEHRFIPITQTSAWNFQQGSMLQWHPKAPNESIVFNSVSGDRFNAVIRDIKTKDERILPLPIANIDQSGRFALSINFSRLFKFRPGYGYPQIADPWANVRHPDADGIWLMDLENGKSELILSLQDIAKVDPTATEGRKILVNHVTFNTDGTRFVFLVRRFSEGSTFDWNTAIYTADLQGRVYPLRDYGYASHYHWRDANHILFHNGTDTKQGLNLLMDQSDEEHTLDEDFFRADGHCSYSPNRQFILYDSYPKNGYRYLYLYDVARGVGMTLAAFRSGVNDRVDIRCDLHPRWNRSGTSISFDSTHHQSRRVYAMDLTELIEKGIGS